MTESGSDLGFARFQRWAPWLLVAAGLLALLPGNGRLPLVDRDEPRFAQAAREMAQRGEWIIPYFNGKYRFDKPALSYWLMRAGNALVGDGEFGARLHSVVLAVLLALLLWHWGRERYGPRAGFVAGLGWLTCAQVLIHGRAAVADMPMVLAVAVAHYAAWRLLREPGGPVPWRWWWTLYVALGLGFLAKGPIALAVPALSLLFLWMARRREPLPWRRLRPLLGLLVVLAVVAPWGVPALVLTHGQYWDQGIEKHVVRRGLGAFNGRNTFVVYYLGTAFFSLFPWIAAFAAVWCWARRRWDRDVALLVGWFLAPYLIFSLYATQLPHYVLPGFPAYFLMLGAVLAEGQPWRRWARVWEAVVLGGGAAAGVGLWLAAALASWPGPYAPLRALLVLLGAMPLALAALALAVLAGRWRWTGAALVALALCFAAFAGRLRPLLPSVQLAPELAGLPPDAPCLYLEYEEPSVVCYTDRPWRDATELGLPPRPLAAFLARSGPRAAVAATREVRLGDFLAWRVRRLTDPGAPLEADTFPEALAVDTPADMRMVTVRGLNLARASWVEVRLWVRLPAAPAEPARTTPPSAGSKGQEVEP